MNEPAQNPFPPLPVAVLGATGAVGQRFIQLLDGHPWFQVVAVTGSTRSVGQTYAAACHWILPEEMPAWAQELVVQPSDPNRVQAPLVFSALPSKAAREIEPRFAQAGAAVCSNASAHREEPDVPLLLPEVNPEHTALIERQQDQRGWPGLIVTNPNCTSTGPTIVLKPLKDVFVVQKVFLVSMQAISGAGYPGVPGLDTLGNVVPYIKGEESKVEWEPRKMLGKFKEGEIELADFTISAHTNRVPVANGHIVCISVSLAEKTDLQEVTTALNAYQPVAEARHLGAGGT
jgi:aspartate-semialdehyde dehydrogenase